MAFQAGTDDPSGHSGYDESLDTSHGYKPSTSDSFMDPNKEKYWYAMAFFLTCIGVGLCIFDPDMAVMSFVAFIFFPWTFMLFAKIFSS